MVNTLKTEGVSFISIDGLPSESCMAHLKEKRKTLALAESCTGGLLGLQITALKGSSSFFVGGWMTYSNSMKENQIDVLNATIENYGAVSEECAREMAMGAFKKAQTDFALSITGIAGPEGGSPENPLERFALLYRQRKV